MNWIELMIVKDIIGICFASFLLNEPYNDYTEITKSN